MKGFNVVNKLKYKYLFQKRDVYYFSKQIPKDIRSHYLKGRMIICLRTKCPKDATKLRDSILSKLNSYWLNLSKQEINFVFSHLKYRVRYEKRIQYF